MHRSNHHHHRPALIHLALGTALLTTLGTATATAAQKAQDDQTRTLTTKDGKTYTVILKSDGSDVTAKVADKRIAGGQVAVLPDGARAPAVCPHCGHALAPTVSWITSGDGENLKFFADDKGGAGQWIQARPGGEWTQKRSEGGGVFVVGDEGSDEHGIRVWRSGDDAKIIKQLKTKSGISAGNVIFQSDDGKIIQLQRGDDDNDSDVQSIFGKRGNNILHLGDGKMHGNIEIKTLGDDDDAHGIHIHKLLKEHLGDMHFGAGDDDDDDHQMHIEIKTLGDALHGIDIHKLLKEHLGDMHFGAGDDDDDHEMHIELKTLGDALHGIDIQDLIKQHAGDLGDLGGMVFEFDDNHSDMDVVAPGRIRVKAMPAAPPVPTGVPAPPAPPLPAGVPAPHAGMRLRQIDGAVGDRVASVEKRIDNINKRLDRIEQLLRELLKRNSE